MKNWNFYRATFLFISISVGLSAMAQAQTVLMLHEDLPPYFYVKDGEIAGSVAKVTDKTLTDAGIDVVWRQTNYGRLRRDLSLGTAPFCAAGYTESHGEIKGVKVTAPVGVAPKASLAIRSSDLPLFSHHSTIAEVLKDPNLRGGFIKELNYFGVTRELFALGADRHIVISGSDVDLGILIARKRIDFAVINREQIDFIRENVPHTDELTTYEPDNMHPAWSMHVICSSAINPELWTKIDKAIQLIQPLDLAGPH